MQVALWLGWSLWMQGLLFYIYSSCALIKSQWECDTGLPYNYMGSYSWNQPQCTEWPGTTKVMSCLLSSSDAFSCLLHLKSKGWLQPACGPRGSPLASAVKDEGCPSASGAQCLLSHEGEGSVVEKWWCILGSNRKSACRCYSPGNETEKCHYE